jgi:hypothetical protein
LYDFVRPPNGAHPSDSIHNTADVTASDFIAQKNNQSEAKISGQPKGSSNAAARSLEAKIEAATSEAAHELIKLYKNKSSKKIKERLTQGYY